MPDLKRIADILREAIDLLEGDDQQERPEPPKFKKKKADPVPCRKCGQPIGFKMLESGKWCPITPDTGVPHDCDVMKGPVRRADLPPDGLPF